MQFFYYCLFVAGIVAADQITKALVVAHIPLGGRMDFLPGFLDFTYLRNTGAAFSSFEGMQWLFALIFLAFTAALFYEYFKKRQPFSGFERWMIAAIYAGGLGNMIDRVLRGYVVDMLDISPLFDYPIFNLADCFVVVGAVLGAVYYLWFYDKYDKKERGYGRKDPDGHN